jgi:hypothetical protein
MFEYAKEGKTTKINLLFKKMHLISTDSTDTNTNAIVSKPVQSSTEPVKKIKIKPNMYSYAAALQSLGCELKTEKTKEISRIKLQVERIIWDMRKANISLDTLADNLHFSSEQQSCIKSALNLVLPNFDFKIFVDLYASSSLMRQLNIKNSKERGERNVNNFYPQEMINKDMMVENFDKQLAFEAKSLTKIPSIIPVDEQSLQEQNHVQILREKILNDFRETVSKNFLKNLTFLKKSEAFEDALLHPFLTFMDHTVYVDLLMQEVIRLSQNSKYFSETTRDISLNIGKALETKYMHFVMKKNGDIDKVSY